jgi:hypothetical protein
MLGPVDRSPARRALIVALLAIPVALIVAYRIPVCPMASLLGIPCPGCGLTRATLAALRGDFGTAYHFHPLVFLLTPVYVGLLGSAILGYVRGPERQTKRQRTLWTSRSVTVLGSALLALVLGVWGARFLGYFGGPAPVERLTLPFGLHAHR